MQSEFIHVTIDAKSGGLQTLTDYRSSDICSIAADRTRIIVEGRTIDLADIPLQRDCVSPNYCKFSGQSDGLEIVREYHLYAERAYFDRNLRVRNVGSSPVLLMRVEDCALEFARPFTAVAYHDDNMTTMDPGTEWMTETSQPSRYQTAINIFLRQENGGLIAGLKYPYFVPEISTTRVSLSYEVNVLLAPSETLELPTMFLGSYQRSGYTCRKALHWTPRIISPEQEEMDWGEVRAMQQVMKDYLPAQKSRFRGYSIWLNAWWSNPALRGPMDDAEAEVYIDLVKQVRQSKCLDMLLIAPVWLGWGNFGGPSPEIDEIGENPVFPRHPAIDRLMEYARVKGMPIYGFCEPHSKNRHYRQDRPDWKLQPTEDASITLTQNCHANPDYEHWFLRLTCSAIDTYNLAGWAWDHAWVRRLMCCYATTHGHQSGNCEFQQYWNVTGMISDLRGRYPDLFLEVYWGLKEAGPWALKGLNSHENAYENGSPPPPEMSFADDMRFQHWYNHNYRFLPTYMNLAQINFGKERNGHLYSILSCLSASSHGSLADWIPFTSKTEAEEIFSPLRRWKKMGEQAPRLSFRPD